MSSDDIWRRFYTRTWSDKRVMALSRPTPNGQTLLTWLIAGRQTGLIPGLFEIGERAFAELLGWPLHAGEALLEDLPKGLPKGFREAFAEVSEQGFVKADWKGRLVYVPGALKLDPPSNPNVVLGWRKAWRELPECGLKDEAEQAIKSFLEGYGKGFQEAFAKVTAKGSPNPLANQEAGSRKQEAGGERAKPRKTPAPKSPETIGEARGATCSPAEVTELCEHWRSEHMRVHRSDLPFMFSEAQREAARWLIGTSGDITLAKRVVTAYVDHGDDEWWTKRQWSLVFLATPTQYDIAFGLATSGKRARTEPGRPVPKNDALAEMNAKFEATKRQIDAEQAAKGARDAAT